MAIREAEVTSLGSLTYGCKAATPTAQMAPLGQLWRVMTVMTVDKFAALPPTQSLSSAISSAAVLTVIDGRTDETKT